MRTFLAIALTAFLISLGAATAQAVRGDAPLEGAEQNTEEPVPAVPEPTALLIFAAGAGVVGWRLRRGLR